MPSWGSIVAVGGGAAVGAWLRWALSIVLNPIFPTIPLGTVAANLIGGLLMGFAMELVTRHTLLAPEMRLLITTGFLGGFTTFSAFSLDAALLWEKNAIALMGAYVLASVGLSILGLFIGLWIVRSLT